jgi:predicted metal-binding membrane protein
MARAVRRLDPGLLVLAATALVAWSALALAASDLPLPALCSAASRTSASLADVLGLALALALNAPSTLALDWTLMLAAMMSPLLVAPLRHVCARSFARRRLRASLLFVAGYAAVWMAVGGGLAAGAVAARWATPAPSAGLLLVAAVALAWQVSPAKQWCLNRCHRAPALAAFGAAADLDALRFGLAHGAACVGSCWALMLLPLAAAEWHVATMAAVAVVLFAERLDGPAPLGWGWHAPGKAVRIVAAQLRMRLAS